MRLRKGVRRYKTPVFENVMDVWLEFPEGSSRRLLQVQPQEILESDSTPAAPVLVSILPGELLVDPPPDADGQYELRLKHVRTFEWS